MAQDSEQAFEFFRFKSQGESICLSRFRTIKPYRSEPLDTAEDEHRKKCPNGMEIPEGPLPSTL